MKYIKRNLYVQNPIISLHLKSPLTNFDFERPTYNINKDNQLIMIFWTKSTIIL